MKTTSKAILLLASLAWLLPHYGQAFYNPNTGRWLSRDPIAWFLGGHGRKFTGIADCCNRRGRICLEVTDTFDFDENDPWPTGSAGDKIKWIGSRCFDVIFGIGVSHPTAGVPVHGKICMDVRL